MDLSTAHSCAFCHRLVLDPPGDGETTWFPGISVEDVMNGAKNGCDLFKALTNSKPQISEGTPHTRFGVKLCHYDKRDKWTVNLIWADASANIEEIGGRYCVYTLEGKLFRSRHQAVVINPCRRSGTRIYPSYSTKS